MAASERIFRLLDTPPGIRDQGDLKLELTQGRAQLSPVLSASATRFTQRLASKLNLLRGAGGTNGDIISSPGQTSKNWETITLTWEVVEVNATAAGRQVGVHFDLLEANVAVQLCAAQLKQALA